MAISYFGHSALSLEETNSLLGELRKVLPVETWAAIRLEAATPVPMPFGGDIAREFGIAAASRFQFTLIDKEQAHRYRPALIAAAYGIFGRDRLFITWELDSIVPPPESTT